MGVLRYFFKFSIALIGLAILGAAVGFILVTYPYANNEDIAYVLGTSSSLIKGIIFDIGGFLFLLGILELVACQTEKGCFIFLVLLKLNVVRNTGVCFICGICISFYHTLA